MFLKRQHRLQRVRPCQKLADLGQGQAQAFEGEYLVQTRDLLRANPKIADEIEAKLRAKLAAAKIAPVAVDLNGASNPEEEEPAPAPKRRN